MNDRGQLQLFESFVTSSTPRGPTSRSSSELSTCSSDVSASPTTGATRTAPRSSAEPRPGAKSPIPSPRVKDGSTLGFAGGAASSSHGARSTVGSEQQPMLPTFTAPITADRMLTVPRPRIRAECLAEARPCPWVGCRHHLMIEVALAKPKSGHARPTSIRLNMASRDRTELGRRPGLRSSAAVALVRQWIDDAVEGLTRKRYTCVLDVAADYPDGVSDAGQAELLGVHEQLIDQEVRLALIKFRARMREVLDDDE